MNKRDFSSDNPGIDHDWQTIPICTMCGHRHATNEECARGTISTINNMFEFLGDTEEMSTEEINKELEAEGIDVDKLMERTHKLIDRLKSLQGK